MHRWLGTLLLLGCSPTAPPIPLDPPAYETPTETAVSAASAPTNAALLTSAVASAKASNAPLAFACTSSADCVWDDPCVPRACVVASAIRPTDCEESTAPDGTCSCVEGMCSKKPNNPVAATDTCEVRGCVVDYGRGRCVADTGGVAEGLRPNTHVNEGPSCDCINPASGCQFNWFDAVPCKSELDCWISDDPRPRPVPRPTHLRQPFKPCKDGTTAPLCQSGKCRIGPHYKC